MIFFQNKFCCLVDPKMGTLLRFMFPAIQTVVGLKNEAPIKIWTKNTKTLLYFSQLFEP